MLQAKIQHTWPQRASNNGVGWAQGTLAEVCVGMQSSIARRLDSMQDLFMINYSTIIVCRLNQRGSAVRAYLIIMTKRNWVHFSTAIMINYFSSSSQHIRISPIQRSQPEESHKRPAFLLYITLQRIYKHVLLIDR